MGIGLVWFGLVWFGYVSSWLFKEMKSGMPDLFVSSMFQISEVRQSRRITNESALRGTYYY
jgi:hypothetical protein